MRLMEYIELQREWSSKTFGPGKRTEGICKHIESELEEIRAEPDSVEEWVDVIILALDGAWRAGFEPWEIINAMVHKQIKNHSREWPDWLPEDQPSFHVKGDDR